MGPSTATPAARATSTIRKGLLYLEVHPKAGEEELRTIKWGNRDIFPVPLEQRRFNMVSYFSFWAIASMAVSTWAFGGSVAAMGLSAGEGIGCIVVASTCVGLFAYLCGDPGAYMHLGFTALARTTFGLYGAYLPVLLLVMENVIFFGIHGYFGGLSAVVIISAMSRSFRDLKNTLPASAAITSQELMGYMIYVIIFLSLLAIPPARFRRLVWPAACCIGVVMFGLFGWAIASNGGKVGHLIPPAVKLTSTTRSFVMLYAITSAAGSATGYGSRMSDWTRFARTRNTPVWPMLLGPPLLSNITAILGILATSAVYTRFHVVLWNPLALLIYLQKYHYSPACRAATFFAGLALFYSLLMNNLMGKIVPAGMDCAGLWPKYITTRRGAIALTIIGVLAQPWRFLSGASTFLAVLSSFGVFVAPVTGIMAADYWIVRRQKWKIMDIFDEKGIYWFTYGVNWRAVVAFALSIVFSMPGFICSINGTPIAVGWTRLYQMCYFVNLAIGISVYLGLSFIFPQVGLGIAEPWDPALLGPSTSSRPPGDATIDPIAAEDKEHIVHVEGRETEPV